MTPFAVQFTFKNECSYSYVSSTGMTPFFFLDSSVWALELHPPDRLKS
ncbi:hypothetical protein [Wolbachia endosymbiont (group A) of Sphecodes ephippius]|nr:hypothetical protein [Wolbachia endosymbiont (group A) of Sphecodes ephippius]